MKKFIAGIVVGSLLFGGAVFARDYLVDFSPSSIPVFNELIRKIWYAIDDRVIRGTTPSQELHDIDDDKAFIIHLDFDATSDWIWALYIGTDYEGEDFNISSTYRKPFLGFNATGNVFMPYITTGTTQAAAGALKDEIWADSDDSYSLKLGQ